MQDRGGCHGPICKGESESIRSKVSDERYVFQLVPVRK